MRDDLLQLKRIEPTNCKKLTAVRIFLIRVGSHGINQVLPQTQGKNQEKFAVSTKRRLQTADRVQNAD